MVLVNVHIRATGEVVRTVRVASHSLMPRDTLALLVKGVLGWGHKNCVITHKDGATEIEPYGEEVVATYGSN